MCFDGALGNMQIASDFRVVTSLEKQIDNLPLSRSYLAELLFHKSLHLSDALRPRQVALNHAPSAHLDSGLCRLILHSRGQISVSMLTNCEISSCALLPL